MGRVPLFCSYLQPERYKVPLFPFLPIASVGLNTFLLGQLPKLSYEVRPGPAVQRC